MKALHLILTAALLLTLCACAPKEDAPALTHSPTPPVTAAPVERPLHSAAPELTPTPTAEVSPSPTPEVTPAVPTPAINLQDNQTPFG